MFLSFIFCVGGLGGVGMGLGPGGQPISANRLSGGGMGSIGPGGQSLQILLLMFGQKMLTHATYRP